MLDRLRTFALRHLVLGAVPQWSQPITLRGQAPDPRVWRLCRITTRLGEPRDLTPARARADFRLSVNALGTGMAPGVRTEDRLLSLAGRDLPLRVYTPANATGGVVYFHGGGWVIGDLDTHDGMCSRMAAAWGRVVVAVAYRLAPEHPFPAGWTDAREAFEAIAADPGAYGFSGVPAVGGDSAGGNLAGHVAVAASPRPSFQWLLYPSTDPAGTWPSRTELGTGLFLTEQRIQWFRSQVHPDPRTRHDPRTALLSADPTGAPPAAVIVCGLDPLADEGHAYADHLEAHGVSVRRLTIAGMVHGFCGFDRIDAADQAMTDALALSPDGA